MSSEGQAAMFCWKSLKPLKVCSKLGTKMFLRVEKNKKSTLRKVATWDNIESERPLSSEKLEARLTGMEDFKKWSVMEETC